MPTTGIAGGRPLVGRAFQVTLRAAAANSGVALSFDLFPQNIPMDINGMPGCTLLAIPLISLPAVSDANGKANVPLLIPPIPALVGGTLFVQWAIPDPGANQLGLVLSNGGRFTLGQP